MALSAHASAKGGSAASLHLHSQNQQQAGFETMPCQLPAVSQPAPGPSLSKRVRAPEAEAYYKCRLDW